MQRQFVYHHNPGMAIHFPCDENGNVDEASLTPQELENYRYCLSGQIPILEGPIWEEQIINNESKWRPALGQEILVSIYDAGVVHD